MKLAIVTPVGNEMENIEQCYNQILTVLGDDTAWIPVFDSYCTDGTYDFVKNIQNKNIYPLHIGAKQGLAKVYIAGNKYALSLNAEKIIEVDVGHPIELIPIISEKLDRVPVVMGTRYGKGSMNQGYYRKFISVGGTILSKILLGLPFSDCTSGLQGFTNQVASKIKWNEFLSTGHFYQTELKYYCKNIPYEEIPFNYNSGNSSLKVKEVVNSLTLVFKMLRKESVKWEQ